MKKLLIIGLLFIACKMPSATNHTKNIRSGFDFQGHRGCRGLMPENSIAAFIKAIDLGVTTLEMDAVITKDGQVLVSHEPFFNHEISTKPNGEAVTEEEEKSLNIYQMNYAEVKRYDVGMKAHPRFAQQHKMAATKPLLTEVIDSVEAYIKQKGLQPVQYNIETKSRPSTDNLYHPAPEKFVDLLMKTVVDKHIETRTTIQSFDIRTLQYLHQQMPSIQTAYLFEDAIAPPSLQKQLDLLGFMPTIYSPAYQLTNKKLVDYCHSKNIKVIPWTVNDLKKMKQLIAMGVDGLISDYPNLYRDLK